MADENGYPDTRDEKVSPHSPSSNENVGDMPAKDVTTDDPTQAEFYRQFAENGAEWRADFEKKIKRKVDLRLIPLLVSAQIRWLFSG
jgi:hypothetical protein